MNQSQTVTEPAVTAAPPKRARGKRLILLLLAVAIVVGAVIFGVHWWTVGRFLESTDDAYVGGDVTVIGPKVPGYITELKVVDNQFVHAGICW